MSAIFKREFKTFFTSPIGYFVLAVLFGFSGFYFFASNMYAGSADLSGVFGGLFTIVLLLVLPVLTMRLLSDDKRAAHRPGPAHRAGEPDGHRAGQISGGAAAVRHRHFHHPGVRRHHRLSGDPRLAGDRGQLRGLLLLGGMVIAIGLFISSLTESQFIAALGTFVVSFAMIMVDSLGSVFSSVKWITSVVNFISVSSRYSDFTSGVINYDNVVFFLSLQALFVFLTVRVLDRKRWS